MHGTYIVAQTNDGIVIVDQHAAHERLVYEQMKAALTSGVVARQMLLLPEIVELEESAVARLAARQQELGELGLVLEGFGPGAVIIRETPAMLGEGDVQNLVRDLAEELPSSAKPWLSRRSYQMYAPAWPAMAACAPGGG